MKSVAICASGRATGSTARCWTHSQKPPPSTAAAAPKDTSVKGSGRRPRAPSSMISPTSHSVVSTAASV